MARGLAEISRMGIAAGAKKETFSGITGLGDLVTTCISQHSRNRSVGEQIGKGREIKEYLIAHEYGGRRRGHCQGGLPLRKEIPCFHADY